MHKNGHTHSSQPHILPNTACKLASTAPASSIAAAHNQASSGICCAVTAAFRCVRLSCCSWATCRTSSTTYSTTPAPKAGWTSPALALLATAEEASWQRYTLQVSGKPCSAINQHCTKLNTGRCIHRGAWIINIASTACRATIAAAIWAV